MYVNILNSHSFSAGNFITVRKGKEKVLPAIVSYRQFVKFLLSLFFEMFKFLSVL